MCLVSLRVEPAPLLPSLPPPCFDHSSTEMQLHDTAEAAPWVIAGRRCRWEGSRSPAETSLQARIQERRKIWSFAISFSGVHVLYPVCACSSDSFGSETLKTCVTVVAILQADMYIVSFLVGIHAHDKHYTVVRHIPLSRESTASSVLPVLSALLDPTPNQSACLFPSTIGLQQCSQSSRVWSSMLLILLDRKATLIPAVIAPDRPSLSLIAQKVIPSHSCEHVGSLWSVCM